MDVLFDIDGTLVCTYPIEDEFYDQALRTIGLSLPTTDYQALGASTDISILRVLAQREWQRAPRPDEIDQVREIHTRLWAERLEREPIRVVTGARAALTELRERGVRFAAATGGFRATATQKLLAAGLDIEIAAAAEDGRDRPELLAHAAGETAPVYVGDGLWDADAAAHNGLRFIAVASAPARADAFRKRGCRVIADLAQLTDALATVK